MPHTLATAVHSELVIKKSRFVGCVRPVTDRAAARAVVAALWREHPAASHVCWALLAGGQSAAVDDGEPSGTAGRPMLDVLRHQDLEGVLATVVRYYGGVNLGAGGLVRAYTDAVASALKGADKVPIVRRVTLRCSAPYALEGLLRREIDAAGGVLARVTHGEAVGVEFSMAEPAAAGLVARLNETGQGRVVWLGDAPD
ncbi:MAG: YigZ family protein [Rhodocyclaceae bacterium]|nr:YigZ family protein [Rhodocyclaceae bacterium]